jgi:hypothetical protein
MNRQPIYATNASLTPKEHFSMDEQQPGVIRPPIRSAYSSEGEYEEAVKIGIEYAVNNNLEYINHY